MRILPEIRSAMVSPNRIPMKNPVWTAIGYLVLILFAVVFLMPLYVMVVTSLKSMDEIRMGHIFALPQSPRLDAWDTAWNKAASGFLNKGLKSGFWNSIKILVPSLLMSVAVASFCGGAALPNISLDDAW